MRILIIEDEFSIAKAVRDGLEAEGHEVAISPTGAEGLDLAGSWAPDVVLLDLGLPDCDGRDVARRIRATSDVPMIIVTARADQADRVAGLEIGADDYVVKPFGLPELLARVRAVTRRTRRAFGSEPATLRILDLVLDVREYRALKDGEPVSLTKTEIEVLRMLLEGSGRLVTRSEIARAVWGLSAADMANTIDVCISSIRRKIGDDPRHPRYIQTIRGVGFRTIDSGS